jgi:hypothetical protein
MTSHWNWRRWPLALAAFLFAAAPALAHEKWFIDPDAYHGAIPDIFRTLTPFSAVVLVLAIGTLLVVVHFDRKFDGTALAERIDARMQSLGLHPRTVLSAVLGVSLLGAGLQKTLFVPSLLLPDSGYGSFLALSEIVVGSLLLFLEPLLAELGIALILLYLAAVPVMPLGDLLEELLVVGAGIYLLTSETKRDPWRRRNTLERQRLGYHAFRILVGLNFLVLASVKWLRPDLAIALVENFHINFVAWAGVDAAHFVFLAAVTETFIAFCILFRVAYRPAAAAAFGFFLLSIFAFGFRELLGHLPVKAALLLLFVVGHWHRHEFKRVE